MTRERHYQKREGPFPGPSRNALPPHRRSLLCFFDTLRQPKKRLHQSGPGDWLLRRPLHSPMTWNTMSRTRSRVSHSTRVRFCQGPTVILPSTKGTVMKGDSSAALM